MSDKINPRDAVHQLLSERFKGASLIFLGGSAAREDWKSAGDLDLVVLYQTPVKQTRQYFQLGGWPVEAIVATADDFEQLLQACRKIGQCAPCIRVAESIAYPQASSLSERIQKKAREVIAQGPEPATNEEIQRQRLSILYLLKKLSLSQSSDDSLSLAAALHVLLCRFFLRVNGKWGITRAHLATRMRKDAPELYPRICQAFRDSFARSEHEGVRKIVAEILAPHGGMTRSELNVEVDPGMIGSSH